MIAQASLQSVPALVVVLVATHRFASRAPALRHFALLGALLATLMMPVIILSAPDWFIPFPRLSTELAPAPAVSGVWASGSTAAQPVGTWAIGISAVGTLSAIWAAGTILLFGRLGFGLIRVNRWLRSAASTGRSRRVPGCRTRVAYSMDNGSPMAAGLIRPTVLMPEAARGWSRQRRRAVLAHELAHCRRGDAWARLAGAVVVALHWPNPLVWLVARRARVAAEEAADQAVLARGNRAEDYADLLLDLVRSATRPSLASAFLGETHGSLRTRLRTLLERPRATRPSEIVAVAAVLVILSVAAGGARPAWDPRITSFAEQYQVAPHVADMVLQAADYERIPRTLAFGLVRVESDFDATRVSRRGAVGYTQILPSSAAALAPGLEPARLHDPKLNLRLGFRLLRDYMDRFPGDTERALLAYAEGPTAARRAQSTNHPGGYPARVLQAAASRP